MLMYARLDSKFKLVETIPETAYGEEIGTYMARALTFKNQLTSLTISDRLGLGKYDPDTGTAQYNTLSNRLDQFTQLTNLTVVSDEEEGIDALNSAAEKCNQDKGYAEATMDMSEYAPRLNIKRVSSFVKGACNNILLYAMHAYPHLEHLQISLHRGTLGFTKPCVVSQFIPYLARIQSHQVPAISIPKNLLTGMLSNYWELMSGNCLQQVTLQYNHAVYTLKDDAFMDLNRQGCSIITTINYKPRENDVPDLDTFDTLDTLEGLGSRIGKLTVDNMHCKSTSPYTTNAMSDYFFDHIFNHCPNLVELTVERTLIDRFDPSMYKNTSIEKLKLKECTLHPNVLSDISLRLPSLKTLTLHDCNPDTYTTIKQYCSMNIDMVNTSFETLTLKYIGYSSMCNKLCLKLSTTGKDDEYYKHGAVWGPKES